MTTQSIHSEPETKRKVPGEAGIWVVIFLDLLLFGALFCTFMYYRAGAPEEFAESRGLMNRDIGIVNTLLLLVASLAVIQGVHAYRARAAISVDRALLVAIVAGVGFMILKFVEYGQKISQDLVPNTNEYFMLYYTFTGVHYFHVVVGVCALIYLRRVAKRKIPDARDLAAIESGASFWHMVDLLWIILFALFYLVG